MIDAKMTIQNNEFDIELHHNDIVQDQTGSTTITTALFTTDWWAGPESGSRFEETVTGVITNDTRQNVQAVLNEIKEELDLENLDFAVKLTAYRVHVQASWRVNGQSQTLTLSK